MTTLKTNDALKASCITLDALAIIPRWVAWQLEEVGGRITKVPYSPRTNGRARANDPSTWGTMVEAMARCNQLPMQHGQGGVGIELGNIGGGQSVGGIDLDTCIDADGTVAPWAQEIIDRFRSYTEI